MRTLSAAWFGRLPYLRALDVQRDLAERRARGETGDFLMLLEHDPVYTLGRRGSRSDIIVDAAARGIDVVESDRGGLVTYHGPGQLVGYPIVDLAPANDVPGYVRALERALIATAARYQIDADALEGAPGIWVGDAKLAAIGVHVSRGITTHGFALNVTTDLDAFNGIVACGMPDKRTTSIGEITGKDVAVQSVASTMADCLALELGSVLESVDAEMVFPGVGVDA